MKIGVCRGF